MRAESLQFTTIGDFIRTRRQEANLTLVQLEEMTGVGKGIISKIENGETKRPEFKTMHALASVLDTAYPNIVELYLSVEQRADVLMSILKESIYSGPSLCYKIAAQFLRDEKKDSTELVGQLYRFAGSIEDAESVRLSLYKLIIKYSRTHGIQDYFAKALLQEYLIERDNLELLHSTYHTGKNIAHYVQFLSSEEQISFYYKIGAHAYQLNKHQESIDFCKQVLILDTTDSVTKAHALSFISFSYYFLDNYDMAEHYLRQYCTFQFPFVQENADFMTAKLNGKKGNVELAIHQMEQCLEKSAHKVNIIYDLFDLYLQQNNLDAIEKLFQREEHLIEAERSNHPSLIAELALYYKNKSEYYKLIAMHEQSVDCLLKSITMFVSVDRHTNAYECIELLFDRLYENCDPINNMKYLHRIKSMFYELNSSKQKIGEMI
ncbi:helix-turn-helix domain-containing protein [Paenibacillus apiarius]|uniref:helix-turn-helix domain-containing protein n=1 Tax=Paenibacillus apiarius TaxID=46240 RepID=UPI003B3BC517